MPSKELSFDELVDNTHCMACHATGNQMKLPTWGDIAERYRVDNNAERYLSNKIAQGGSGAWGKVDMPPYKELTELELKVLARGILAAKL